MRVRAAVVAWMVGILAAAGAWGQALVDKIPDDAMVYVGWKGSGNLGDAYQQSHLKHVLDATDVRTLFNKTIPQLMDKVGQKDPQAAEKMRVIATLAEPVFKYESAFYFGGMTVGNGQPQPKFAILVRAGADAPALLKQINDVIQQAGPTPVKIEATAYGDLVAVTTGRWDAFDALLGGKAQAQPAPALKGSPKFQAAMNQVQKDPVMACYIDADAILKMADGFVVMANQPRQQQQWHRIEEFIGLRGLKQIACTGGFEGKDWVGQGFVAAPAPRPGLLGAFEAAAVGDDTLKMIPQDSTLASAGRFDVSEMIAQVKKSAAASDPNLGRQIDQALAEASRLLGLDLENDVLAGFGDQWVAYVSPSVGGEGALGGVVVNKLKDPAKAESGLSRLELRIDDLINQQTHGEPSIRFKVQQQGDLKLHYFAFPLITPTWTIADGNLYIALYPQAVVSAVAQAKAGGPSILQNEHFTALRQRLGGEKASGISFMDLPRTAPMAYPAWMAISRYVGLADLFGVDGPLMMIPPLGKLLPEVEPAGQVSWVDDAGFHSRGVTPFPGANAIASDPLATVMVAQPAIAASILLPAFGRARENAQRVRAASNLRQVGVGLLMYANTHQGQYPSTLGELAQAENLDASVFVSPASNTRVPGPIGDKQKLAEWVNQNADYVYLGSGKKSADLPPDTVMAYEKPEIHRQDGFNMLFADGHVEWMNYSRGMEQIKAQHDRDQAAPATAK